MIIIYCPCLFFVNTHKTII